MHIWEDNLVERKVESDLKDLLKTAVAFANSVKPGHVASIIIGERDDGTPVGVKDPDSIQQRVRKECEKAYPPIIWRSRVEDRGGHSVVVVEIEHSGLTPHFGGPSWVRQGSSTVIASESQLQLLIDIRSTKVAELAKWIDRDVTVRGDSSTVPPSRKGQLLPRILIFSHRWSGRGETVRLVLVNQFWSTFLRGDGRLSSEPLEKLMLTFDDEHERLAIIVRY